MQHRPRPGLHPANLLRLRQATSTMLHPCQSPTIYTASPIYTASSCTTTSRFSSTPRRAVQLHQDQDFRRVLHRQHNHRHGLHQRGLLPSLPLMSTNASTLADSVGPPSAEVCRTAASFQVNNPTYIELREVEVKDIPLKHHYNYHIWETKYHENELSPPKLGN